MKGHYHAAHVQVECKVCGEKFSTHAYRWHSQTAHVDKNIKNFICDQCGYRSYAQVMIDKHILRYHEKSRPKKPRPICEKCGESAQHPYLLKEHNCAKNLYEKFSSAMQNSDPNAKCFVGYWNGGCMIKSGKVLYKKIF